MTKLGQIEQFIDEISLVDMALLAAVLDVECDILSWLDDDYPDKIDDLAVELIDALVKVVIK